MKIDDDLCLTSLHYVCLSKTVACCDSYDVASNASVKWVSKKTLRPIMRLQTRSWLVDFEPVDVLGAQTNIIYSTRISQSHCLTRSVYLLAWAAGGVGLGPFYKACFLSTVLFDSL
ncbi:hypothetical protein BD408DRAFT_415694 [Parasitella parasitica]|nr:hypothetical protein BD408DRAFT_415694 [Parasitella parasitica]